ncbi:MAG TPA: 4-hydroxybenzoate octaprenyltransferase [Gammaproteobacteria bacterium]
MRVRAKELYRKHSPYVYDRIQQYALLIRFHRPIGTLLLGWPAFWGLWLAAEGLPDMGILLVFIAGVFVMRSAGCVINDYADRKIDPHVERTRDRPLAAGRVSEREALVLFLVLGLVAFALVLTLNELTILLSLAAVVSAASYPFMKRYTYLPQAFLGIAFAWAIPMAWAAQTGTVPQVSWLLFIIVVLWAMAYDTMYAMADREDDIKIGVKSTAILFGEADRLIIAVIQLCVLLGLVMLGGQLSMGYGYYLGLTAAAGLSVYQQYLIRNRNPKACFQAFLNNNWFGAVVFAGIVANYHIFNS